MARYMQGKGRKKHRIKTTTGRAGHVSYAHDPDHEVSPKTRATLPGKMWGHGRRVAKKKKGIRVL